MNVATIELCKELFELSGWGHGMGDRTAWEYTQYEEGSNWRVTPWGYGICYASHVAYDLGYLLRNLPRSVKGDTYRLGLVDNVNSYRAGYYNERFWEAHEQYGDTPEDAACQLAIALFKQDILKRK